MAQTAFFKAILKRTFKYISGSQPERNFTTGEIFNIYERNFYISKLQFNSST